MKKLIFATAVAGSLFGLAAGTAAQAVAAPSGTGPALDTVNSQESNGYHVSVNKVGTTPLELCTIDSALPNRRTDLRPNRMVLEPVYLIANC
jgi:hypothetical protein